MNLLDFLKKINISPVNIDLYSEAITHPSLSKQNKNLKNYQRLEFLGDKILSFVISKYLFNKFADENEGDLSKRQSLLISGETLSQIAASIEINKILKMSKGESSTGGEINKRNLENALEALIAAIYLDQGLLKAEEFILTYWHDFLSQNINPPQDAVSHLQELTQLKKKKLPTYQTIKIGGSEHNPIFRTIVKIPDSDLEFIGEGNSKKISQKIAAQNALENLEDFS